MAKFDDLELNRPRCAHCETRMMRPKPGGDQFQCFRCGYVGPAAAGKREAASAGGHFAIAPASSARSASR